METSSQMAEPPSDDERAVRFETTVSDQAVAFVAGGNQYIRLADGAVRTLSGTGDKSECPYPGLAPFGPESTKWFFGRDRMIATVCERLDSRLRERGPLVVIGPSGSGKSSLLAAGVLPALADGRLPATGSSDWPRILVTPTASPAESLATTARIDRASQESPAQYADRFHEAARDGIQQGLVVVVDQFEEVFTLCADDAERRWFIGVLDSLAQRDNSLVVLGVRADFYAACVAYPELRTALRADPVLLDPMTEDELRQAIRLPATTEGLEVEDGLIALLVAELGATWNPDHTATGEWTGRLPLLAHALRVTWMERTGKLLTTEGYRTAGGIRGAISKTADRLFVSLAAESQAAARSLFLRLVVVGRDADDTRRRGSRRELLATLPNPEAADAVIDIFARGRLLTLDRDSVTITHEALIHAWPKLRGWLEHDRADNLVRQDLEEAAAAWDRADREPTSLYRGNRLHAAQVWTTAYPDEISPAVGAFVSASRRQERRGRRLRRTIVAGIAALALIASATAVFAFQQESQARADAMTAIDNEITAEALQLQGTDPARAAQLALTAYRLAPSPNVASNLVNTENTPFANRMAISTAMVDAVAFSPRGHVMATASDSVVRLWDTADPNHTVWLGELPKTASLGIRLLAFSPDGRTLATGGALRLWNVAVPAHPALLAQTLTGDAVGAGQGAVSLSFDADGHTLAIMENGPTHNAISLWDVADPSHPIMMGTRVSAPDFNFDTVAISPDGRALAVLAAGNVQLWDVSDPNHPADVGQLSGQQAAAVTFSPVGNTLAVSTGATIQLWDTSNPHQPAALGQPLSPPTAPSVMDSIAFAPNGVTLAAGLHDGVVCLWNVADLTNPTPLGQPLPASVNPLDTVAFSQDGHTLATGAWNGTVTIWRLPPTLLIGAGGATAVAFSGDGHLLAVGDGTGVQLWNTTDPTNPTPLGRRLPGSGDPVTDLAFSPDDRALADDTPNGISLWDITNPANVGPPVALPCGSGLSSPTSLVFSADGRLLTFADRSQFVSLWHVTKPPAPCRRITAVPGRQVEAVAFSPRGGTLAIGFSGYADSGSGVLLWHVTDSGDHTPIGPAQPDPANTIGSLVFGPDGNTLVVGDSTGSIRILNTRDPADPTLLGQTPAIANGAVESLAYSPDGRTLAAGGEDNVVRLWDMTDPAAPVNIDNSMSGAAKSISSVAFSPGGPTLAAAGKDGTVRLWDLDVNYAIKRICADTTDALTRQQWPQYIPPQIPYQPPC